MRLKSFYAKTMTEAMQMVRDTLGEDAIIVATREEQGGKAVRVTAAIDPSDYSEPNFEIGHGNMYDDDPADDQDWLQYDEEDEQSAVAEEITDAMLKHNLPEDVMDHIISCATVIGLENPGIALIASLEHLFHFRPLPKKVHNKPMMLVGPPGAGKTLAIAKMATRATMEGLRVGVITTDTIRAGGIEQLQGFMKLLGTTMKKASNPQELKDTIHLFQGYDQILIDTPGINPFEKNDARMIARLIGAESMDVHLVMPAGGDALECGEIARAFAVLGVQTILPTRIDMARRLGGILSAAHHGGLCFTDASNTPKVAEGLFSLTPKILAKLIMPHAYKVETSEPRRRTGTH